VLVVDAAIAPAVLARLGELGETAMAIGTVESAASAESSTVVA